MHRRVLTLTLFVLVVFLIAPVGPTHIREIGVPRLYAAEIGSPLVLEAELAEFTGAVSRGVDPEAANGQYGQFDGRVVDVKADYGAKGDGRTDDLAALQAAIDDPRVPAPKTVFLPAGVYLVSSTLYPKTDVAIVGAGGGASVIKLKSNAAESFRGGVLYLKGQARVRVAFLTVDGNEANQFRRDAHMAGIYIAESDKRVPSADITIEYCEITQTGNAILGYAVQGAWIHHNTIHDTGTASVRGGGVLITGRSPSELARDIVIDANTISNVSETGIGPTWVDGLVIANNTLNGTGGAAQTVPPPFADARMDAGSNVLRSVDTAFRPSQVGMRLLVQGAGPVVDGQPTDYKTWITHVDAPHQLRLARPAATTVRGATVVYRPSTDTAISVNGSSNVRITNNDMDNFSQGGVFVRDLDNGVTARPATGVLIRGNRIRRMHSSPALVLRGNRVGGVDYVTKDITVVDNHFADNDSSAVQFNGLVEDVTIANNAFVNNAVTGAGGFGDTHIFVPAGSLGATRRVRITNNSFSGDHTRVGVAIHVADERSAAFTLARNRISGFRLAPYLLKGDFHQIEGELALLNTSSQRKPVR